MRLIQSIFNEYKIYSASLADESGNIHDPEKLLAILIYKNVHPRDFEELHQQRGVLAQVLDKHDEYVASTEEIYKTQIRILEKQITEAKEQLPADTNDLNRIYAMALMELLPQGYTSVRYNNRTIVPSELIACEEFEKLVHSDQVTVTNHYNNSTRVNISNLHANVG